jgi:hypothetical protein
MTREAQDALDGVHAAKRRGALMKPDGADDECAQKAKGVRWTGPNAFDRDRTRTA